MNLNSYRQSSIDDKNDKKEFKLKFFSSKKTSYLLLCFTFFFAFLCVFVIFETRNLKSLHFDYTNCKPVNQTLKHSQDTNRTLDRSSKICRIEFSLKSDWNGMIYIHYHMVDFYKNFFMFSESYSKRQLMGDFSLEMLDECNFFTDNQLIDFNGTCALAPCGELANFMFNDTFRIYYLLNDENKTRLVPIEIDYYDLSDNYFRMNFNNPSLSSISLVRNHTRKPRNWKQSIFELDENDHSNNAFLNQRFIVWMFPNHFSDFSKLYGRIIYNFQDQLKRHLNMTTIDTIDTNEQIYLKKGIYILEIDYNYPLWSIHSKKKVSLSNLSLFGQKNLKFKLIIFTALIVSFISMILVYLIYKLHDEYYRFYINDNSDFKFLF